MCCTNSSNSSIEWHLLNAWFMETSSCRATVVKRSEKSVQPPWAEYFDTKTQRYYYVNSDTGESTWNKCVQDVFVVAFGGV